MDDSFPEIHKSEGILNVKGRNKTMNIKAEQKQKVTLPSRYSGIRFTTAQPIRRSSGMKKKNSGTCFTPSAVPRMFRSVCPGCMEQPLALQQAGMAQNGCTAEHLRDLILSRDTIRSGHRRSSRQRVCITCMSPTSPAFQTIGSIRDGCCIILRQTSGTGDLKDGLISIPSA